MSDKCIAKIKETCTAKASEYRYLLALAADADDNGLGACPSDAALIWRVRVGTARTIRNMRRRCSQQKLVIRRQDKSDRGTWIVDIVFEDGSNREAILALHPDYVPAARPTGTLLQRARETRKVWDGLPPRTRRDTFARIAIRDGMQCRICGTASNLSTDHVKPLSRGGTNDDENLQILCRSCNSTKKDRVTE